MVLPQLSWQLLLRKLRLSKARIFIHESNVVLGKMNAVAAQFADVVGVVSSRVTKAIRAKSIAVGYPVRPKTMGLDRAGPGTSLAFHRMQGLSLCLEVHRGKNPEPSHS